MIRLKLYTGGGRLRIWVWHGEIGLEWRSCNWELGLSNVYEGSKLAARQQVPD